MFISPPSLATPTNSLWMAGGAGEGGRREGKGSGEGTGPNSKWLHISEWTFESVVRTQYEVLHLRFFGGEENRENSNEMETRRTFEMHIYRGTDLELSPTTTVIFFFKWQWSQCIRKQCYHLAASRGTLCTETCTVKDHGLLEDRGRYGLQGFAGYRAVESESSSDLESSSAKDLSLTQEQIKTDCSCSLPQPCWARGPSHMGLQTATKIWPYTESQ